MAATPMVLSATADRSIVVAVPSVKEVGGDVGGGGGTFSSSPVPFRAEHSENRVKCTEMAKKVCPRLCDSACWRSSKIAQPRTHFFGQLCSVSAKRPTAAK